MSNYYAKREARVNIAHALMDLGWKVYGYKEDQSDSMTDYYSPANWDGIATKNGFILVVDNRTGNEPREIKKWNPKGSLSHEDQEKITKLSKMTMVNGATEGEERNAKILMEKLQNKVSNEPQYFVTGVIPGHMGNPGRSIWHIEKDGKIYDKGNALTKYADIPPSWMFDIKTMKYTDHYKEVREWNQNTNQWEMVDRKLSEEQEKTVNNFKNLLLRFERVVNGMNTCGDGTKETEQAGLEQQQKEGYEKVIKKVTKTVTKPVQKDNTNINLGDVLSFSYHGHYWIVDSIYQNNEGKTCIVYELLGSEKRGYQRLKNGKRYYQPETRLQKEMAEGKVKVYTLQEVEEVQEVEKWVKINNKKTNNSKTKTEQKEQTNHEPVEQKQTTDNILNHEITITADTDTRDNSPLWVVKIIDTLSKEEYKKVAEQLKALKGYYSKFKHGFIFKYDPAEALKGEQQQTQPEQQTNQEDQSKYIERIEKAIESNNNKIKKLSGDYLTNTPKRAREQASRDNQKEKLQNDNSLLEYLKEKAEQNTMTDLEKAITVNTTREEVRYYYLQKYEYKNNVEYPQVNYSSPLDGWWNLEVPKRQKRLNKANIFNTNDLLKALEEYKNIIIALERPKNPITEQIKQKERELKFCKIPGYFPTPKSIVDQMIKLAELQEGETILEPSAGNGNIADSITALGYKVDVIELNYSLQELLKLKGYNLITDDFLSYSNYNRYNKILMNPPFSLPNNRTADITHVKHAYKMLKNNGRIVAIMSPHFTFASDKESIDFREWLSDKGYYEKLPEGSFKNSGTNVNSVIVVINKKENDMSQAG